MVGLVAVAALGGAPQITQVRSVAGARSAQLPAARLLQATDPGALAADAAVPQVELFSQPGVSTGRTLSRTPEGSALVFLVVAQQPGWVEVQLPERPNEATAWVRATDVRTRTVRQRIVVNLARHTVTLLSNGVPVLSTPSVIGSPQAPTPTGRFYVTSIIHLDNPNGPYGAGALGLAAFSNVYETFGGGPGQVAIHGTNQPQLVGQSVSHGCVRVPNEAWATIAGRIPTGTPVVIES